MRFKYVFRRGLKIDEVEDLRKRGIWTGKKSGCSRLSWRRKGTRVERCPTNTWNRGVSSGFHAGACNGLWFQGAGRSATKKTSRLPERRYRICSFPQANWKSRLECSLILTLPWRYSMHRISWSIRLLVAVVLSIGTVVAQQAPATGIWNDRILTTVPKGVVPTSDHWDSWISITPDLSTFAYSSRFRSGDYWREAIVIGDQRGPEYIFASRPVVSPDGKHVAYIGASRENDVQGFPAFLVLGKSRVQVQIKDTLLGPQWIPKFSPDSKKLAFMTERPSGKYSIGVINVDGHSTTGEDLAVQWGPEFRGTDAPVWSPDSSRVAYAAAREKDEWVVVVGTEPVASFQDATGVAFSPDGKIAFVASDGKKRFIVLGTEQQATFDQVTAPFFQPDGTLVYAACDTGKYFLMTEKVRSELPHAGKRSCGSLFWNPSTEGVVVTADGKRITHWYREPKKQIMTLRGRQARVSPNAYRMVINGVPGPYFTRVSRPAIHAETGTYAYTAQQNERGRQKFYVVTARGSSPPYEGVQWEPRISEDGATAGYVALIKNQLWWKVLRLK